VEKMGVEREGANLTVHTGQVNLSLPIQSVSQGLKQVTTLSPTAVVAKQSKVNESVTIRLGSWPFPLINAAIIAVTYLANLLEGLGSSFTSSKPNIEPPLTSKKSSVDFSKLKELTDKNNELKSNSSACIEEINAFKQKYGFQQEIPKAPSIRVLETAEEQVKRAQAGRNSPVLSMEEQLPLQKKYNDELHAILSELKTKAQTLDQKKIDAVTLLQDVTSNFNTYKERCDNLKKGVKEIIALNSKQLLYNNQLQISTDRVSGKKHFTYHPELAFVEGWSDVRSEDDLIHKKEELKEIVESLEKETEVGGQVLGGDNIRLEISFIKLEKLIDQMPSMKKFEEIETLHKQIMDVKDEWDNEVAVAEEKLSTAEDHLQGMQNTATVLGLQESRKLKKEGEAQQELVRQVIINVIGSDDASVLELGKAAFEVIKNAFKTEEFEPVTAPIGAFNKAIRPRDPDMAKVYDSREKLSSLYKGGMVIEGRLFSNGIKSILDRKPENYLIPENSGEKPGFVSYLHEGSDGMYFFGRKAEIGKNWFSSGQNVLTQEESILLIQNKQHKISILHEQAKEKLTELETYLGQPNSDPKEVVNKTSAIDVVIKELEKECVDLDTAIRIRTQAYMQIPQLKK
jgi:hypothetical protein